MKFSGRLPAVIQLVVVLGLVCNPRFAFAYDHPLSDEAVRDAYFVGQDVKTVNTFLAQYTQHLPVPRSGPHVAEIALSTPFAQVVEVSAQHSVGYSDLQAAEDYRKRGDSIAVRVKVFFTPTYTNRAEDFWRDVSVGLIQKKHMAATKVDGQPIYSSDTYGGGVLMGADIYVQFSIAGVRSDSLQVEVIPPEGAPVYATFDLSKLR